MTGKKLDPYAQRLTDCDNWLLLPENTAQLAAAASGLIALDRCAAVLRLLVSRTDRTSGTVDQTIPQISAATLQSGDQVKRAIKVLADIGVLVTVTGARSGGAGGAAGRAPVRRVAFLSPVDNAGMAVQLNGNGSAVNGNGSAADCTPLRIISTHISTHLENDLSENLTDTQNGAPASSSWSDLLLADITDQLVRTQTSSKINSPEAFRLSRRALARTGLNKAEQRFGELVRLITPGHAEYGSLIDWCAAVASGQEASTATYQILKAACGNMASTA